MSSKKPLSARGSPRVKGSGKKKKKKSSPRQTNSLEAKKASPSVSLPTEPSDVLEWKRSLHRFKWALEEEKESPNGHIKAPRVPATFSEMSHDAIKLLQFEPERYHVAYADGDLRVHCGSQDAFRKAVAAVLMLAFSDDPIIRLGRHRRVLNRLNKLFEDASASVEELMSGLVELWRLLTDPNMIAAIVMDTVPRLCTLLLRHQPPEENLGTMIFSLFAALLTIPEAAKMMVCKRKVFEYCQRFRRRAAKAPPPPTANFGSTISEVSVLPESKKYPRGVTKLLIKRSSFSDDFTHAHARRFTWRFVGLAWGAHDTEPGSAKFFRTNTLQRETFRRASNFIGAAKRQERAPIWTADDDAWLNSTLGLDHRAAATAAPSASASASSSLADELLRQWQYVKEHPYPQRVLELAGGGDMDAKTWRLWSLWPAPTPKLLEAALPPSLRYTFEERFARMFAALLSHSTGRSLCASLLLPDLIALLHDHAVAVGGLWPSHEAELAKAIQFDRRGLPAPPTLSMPLFSMNMLLATVMSDPDRLLVALDEVYPLHLLRISASLFSSTMLLDREYDVLKSRWAALLCVLGYNKQSRGILVRTEHFVWNVSELLAWSEGIEPVIIVLRRIRQLKATGRKLRNLTRAFRVDLRSVLNTSETPHPQKEQQEKPGETSANEETQGKEEEEEEEEEGGKQSTGWQPSQSSTLGPSDAEELSRYQLLPDGTHVYKLHHTRNRHHREATRFAAVAMWAFSCGRWVDGRPSGLQEWGEKERYEEERRYAEYVASQDHYASDDSDSGWDGARSSESNEGPNLIPPKEILEDAVRRQIILACGFLSGSRDPLVASAALGTMCSVAYQQSGAEIIASTRLIKLWTRRIYVAIKDSPGSRAHEIGSAVLCWIIHHSEHHRERVWKECGAYYVARISIIQASRLLFKWFKCQELKFTSLRGELRTFDCLEGGSAYDEGLSQEQASRWLAIAKFSVDSLLRLSHTPLQLTDEFSIALYHLFRCGDPDLTMNVAFLAWQLSQVPSGGIPLVKAGFPRLFMAMAHHCLRYYTIHCLQLSEAEAAENDVEGRWLLRQWRFDFVHAFPEPVANTEELLTSLTHEPSLAAAEQQKGNAPAPKEPKELLSLLQIAMGYLWRYVESAAQADVFVDYGGLHLLLSTIYAPYPALSSVQHLACGVLWRIATYLPHATVLIGLETPVRLFNIAAEEGMPLHVRLVALQCLAHLVTLDEAAVVRQLHWFHGKGCFELLLCDLASFQRPLVSRVVSTHILASLSGGAVGNRLGSINAELHLIPTLENTLSEQICGNVLTILLNMSTHAGQLVALGKHGFDTFFSFAQATKFPGLARIAAKIMANIIRHPKNKAVAYRKELSVRSHVFASDALTLAGVSDAVWSKTQLKVPKDDRMLLGPPTARKRTKQPTPEAVKALGSTNKGERASKAVLHRPLALGRTGAAVRRSLSKDSNLRRSVSHATGQGLLDMRSGRVAMKDLSLTPLHSQLCRSLMNLCARPAVASAKAPTYSTVTLEDNSSYIVVDPDIPLLPSLSLGEATAELLWCDSDRPPPAILYHYEITEDTKAKGIVPPPDEEMLAREEGALHDPWQCGLLRLSPDGECVLPLGLPDLTAPQPFNSGGSTVGPSYFSSLHHDDVEDFDDVEEHMLQNLQGSAASAASLFAQRMAPFRLDVNPFIPSPAAVSGSAGALVDANPPTLQQFLQQDKAPSPEAPHPLQDPDIHPPSLSFPREQLGQPPAEASALSLQSPPRPDSPFSLHGTPATGTEPHSAVNKPNGHGSPGPRLRRSGSATTHRSIVTIPTKRRLRHLTQHWRPDIVDAVVMSDLGFKDLQSFGKAHGLALPDDLLRQSFLEAAAKSTNAYSKPSETASQVVRTKLKELLQSKAKVEETLSHVDASASPPTLQRSLLSHNDSINVQAVPEERTPFAVWMKNKTPRNLFSFHTDRKEAKSNKGPVLPPPSLVSWPHVPGSKVGQGVFDSYQLPDGRTMYFYHKDDIHSAAVSSGFFPPPAPSTKEHIYHDSFRPPPPPPTPEPSDMPAELFNFGATIPKVPTPSKDNDNLWGLFPTYGSSDFDDLCKRIAEEGTRIPLVVEAARPPPVEEVKEDTKEAAAPPPRSRFSAFKQRKLFSESRHYFNTEKVSKKAFARDWEHIIAKPHLEKFLSTADKTRPVAELLEEARKTTEEVFEGIWSTFEYYSAISASADLQTIHLNEYYQFLQECHIPEEGSDVCAMEHMDLIFVVVNLEMGGDDGDDNDDAVNPDRSLMRFEFVDAVVRIGITKYLLTNKVSTVKEAIQAVVSNNLMGGHWREGHALNGYEFRNNRLYHPDVNDVLLKRGRVLELIHRAFSHPERLVISRAVARIVPYHVSDHFTWKKPVMSLAGWLRLLELTHCIDDDFTKREAVLAFVWSKMRTSDNFNDRNYQKVTHLQYTDFIEAICRVAEMKSMPTDEELEPFDGNTVAMYKAYTENNKPFERRPSSQWYNPKTRPLAEKLQKFISILCHELDMSVGNGDGQLSKSDFVKYIKEADQHSKSSKR